MYHRYCPVCKKYSYSASQSGDWICPYCKTNLSQLQNKGSDFDVNLLFSQ